MEVNRTFSFCDITHFFFSFFQNDFSFEKSDARVVLCRGNRAFRLSYDHKATDEVEAERCRATHMIVVFGKV